MDSGSTEHLILSADVVSSTKLPERERGKVQLKLTRLVSDLNDKFAHELRTRLLMVAGDSFQAVIQEPSAIPDILWDIWTASDGVEVRIGIGFGRIYTEFNEDSRLMDGPAFHNATKFGTGERGIVFHGFGTAEDRVLNGLGALLRVVFLDFTARQEEALMLVRGGMAQSSAAETLGISKQAVSQLVNGSGWPAYKQGESAMREALVLFTGRNGLECP